MRGSTLAEAAIGMYREREVRDTTSSPSDSTMEAHAWCVVHGASSLTAAVLLLSTSHLSRFTSHATIGGSSTPGSKNLKVLCSYHHRYSKYDHYRDGVQLVRIHLIHMSPPSPSIPFFTTRDVMTMLSCHSNLPLPVMDCGGL